MGDAVHPFLAVVRDFPFRLRARLGTFFKKGDGVARHRLQSVFSIVLQELQRLIDQPGGRFLGEGHKVIVKYAKLQELSKTLRKLQKNIYQLNSIFRMVVFAYLPTSHYDTSDTYETYDTAHTKRLSCVGSCVRQNAITDVFMGSTTWLLHVHLHFPVSQNQSSKIARRFFP